MADVADNEAKEETAPRGRRLLRSLLRWETMLVVLLLATIAYGASVSPYFLEWTNLFFIGLNVGEIAIIALPLTLIIITGEIDLSVASMLGLTGLCMRRPRSPRYVRVSGLPASWLGLLPTRD